MKLISLEVWAERRYDDVCRPTINTLRRWARESRISPLPEKHGRTYYVEEAAVYVDPARTPRLVQRIHHGRSTA